jgi:drug/metabolite transporter (DMT)-like permease
MEYVGPFTYNGIRFVLGSLSLLPLILFRKARARRYVPREDAGGSGRMPEEAGSAPIRTAGRRRKFLYTLAAGSCLFFAVALQQLGIMFTTVGNAGFITGLYVVLTPIFGIALGKKTGLPTWVGAVFTLTGLYFLSAAGHLTKINPGDIIIVISALFWAFHVLLIDRLVRNMDPIQLSSGQFAWCGLYSLIAAFVLEPFVGSWAEFIAPDFPALPWRSLSELAAGLSRGSLPGFFVIDALIPILYGGLGSVGVAYTLQVVAQQDAPPAHATIILCLEGVFAALGGVLLLAEPLGPWTLLGFALMLGGMLATQWDVIARGTAKAQRGGG